jgi:outer membrane beta-barrel protein
MNIKSNIFNIFAIFTVLVFMQNSALAQQISEAETEIPEAVQEQEPSEPQVQEIKIDEDELPGESVTPKTDITSNVINKKVNYKKRFLVDINTGSILDEPLVNSNYFLVRAAYFTSEELYFGVGFKSRFGDNTSYAEQLSSGTAQLQFGRVPKPTQSHFLSAGYNFYYGKLSFSKDTVITASTRLDTDFGMQAVGTTNKPFVQTAVTQSFYVNRNIALGLSIGLSISQTYDTTSVNIRSTEPIPNESAFAEKNQFNQFLSANLSFLL